MSINVDATPKAVKQFFANLKAMMGNITLSADDLHWQRLKMWVTNLTIYFADDSNK